MDPAYRYGKPTPKIAWNKVQYLHSRYLKLSVNQKLDHDFIPFFGSFWHQDRRWNAKYGMILLKQKKFAQKTMDFVVSYEPMSMNLHCSPVFVVGKFSKWATKKPYHFPWNTGCLIGIRIMVSEIIPTKLGRISSPIYTLNNQGPLFVDCSNDKVKPNFSSTASPTNSKHHHGPSWLGSSGIMAAGFMDICSKSRHLSSQIMIFHQPRFPWNKGISLTKPPFGVRSCEVAIIWPDLYNCWNLKHQPAVGNGDVHRTWKSPNFQVLCIHPGFTTSPTLKHLDKKNKLETGADVGRYKSVTWKRPLKPKKKLRVLIWQLVNFKISMNMSFIFLRYQWICPSYV